MAEHTTDTNALPDAAWYATEIMEWQFVYSPSHYAFHAWYDAHGIWQAHKRWDPKTHDDAALHIFQRVAQHCEGAGILRSHDKWSCDFGMVYSSRRGAFGVDTVFCLAICHAVQAWWLAQQGGT